MLYIDDEIAYEQYKKYLGSNPESLQVRGDTITTKDYIVTVEEPYQDLLELAKDMTTVKYLAIVENSGYKFKTY
tara:strand:+ start:302 stop:523 length:222 start_codon:yes stop_codon:yes gene_type:complete